MLEIELTSKSKELASLALDMAQRQRVIDNLKDTISEQKRKGSITTNDIDSLLKHIDSDIGDSEFWNIYHNNFDLIHENFFRNLVASYPTLTPVDLRFCALLRLNLSTKDIAKFTSLTVRGVETARYRLRKKLGIKDKES
ncbi:MAG: helix-turn-helix transcriptional regulator, partial [Muribaculaceae bacterium]